MRLLAAGTVLIVFGAALRAAEPRECADLSAKIDHDVSSPSGVRVIVTARNHCQEDLEGEEIRFKVKVLASGSAVVGTQRGRFGGVVSHGGQAETMVFVECDPDRGRSVTVDLQ